MSTLLHDVPSQTAFAVALSPRTITDGENGPSVELTDGDGPVFAAIQLGGLEAGTEVTVEFEQSAGGGSWSGVPVTVPTLTAANAVTVATFPWTARYLRCLVALDGPSPQADIAVLLGQQKKLV